MISLHISHSQADHPFAGRKAADLIFQADGNELHHHLYSSHSLRRGFASWASANGWEMRTLMEYVGWKNINSASRYVDSPDPYHREMLERLIPKTPPALNQS